MRGRKPKPAEIKTIEGNRSKVKEIKKGVKGKVSDLSDDDDLFKHLEFAKEEFNRLKEELQSLQIVTKLDENQLKIYCVLYARWKIAELTNDTKSSIHYVKEIKAFATEFGMTPVSRLRLTTHEDDPEEKAWGDLLN